MTATGFLLLYIREPTANLCVAKRQRTFVSRDSKRRTPGSKNRKGEPRWAGGSAVHTMRSGEITIRVRYAETDRMGLLHHANYLVYFEQGRTELFAGPAGPTRTWKTAAFFWF